jgi:hypothetical protein
VSRFRGSQSRAAPADANFGIRTRERALPEVVRLNLQRLCLWPRRCRNGRDERPGNHLSKLARVTGGAWLQDRAGLGLRADNAHIICRMVITVDLADKKNPACGATRCGVSTCAPDEDLGTLRRSRWRILPRGMTDRRTGFRRRNNRIFINVDIDPGWLGLRLETY